MFSEEELKLIDNGLEALLDSQDVLSTVIKVMNKSAPTAVEEAFMAYKKDLSALTSKVRGLLEAAEEADHGSGE